MPQFSSLNSYIGGWFLGNFEPSLLRIDSFEVCVVSHRKMEATTPHYHTQSEEINLILDGRLMVSGRVLEKNDIFVYSRFEISDVEFLEDSRLLVVRVPSAPNDKVLIPK